jgi:hypothetical protein
MTPFRAVGYGRQRDVRLPQPTMDLTGALKFAKLLEYQLDGLLHAPIWFLLDSIFVCNLAIANSNGLEQLTARCLEFLSFGVLQRHKERRSA